MGNDVAALDGRASRELASAEGLFDADGYRALSSDIAAHLVFTHQTGMTNLLTRASWEARAADPSLHPPFTSSPEEDARVAVMMSRRRERGRGLPVVHRRNEADRPGPRRVGLRGAVLDHRAARSEGALAARARSESAPHEISLQLFDLLAGVRRVAARREGPDLQAHVAGVVGTGTGRTLPVGAVACGPSGHRRNPARHQEGPSARISRT